MTSTDAPRVTTAKAEIGKWQLLARVRLHELTALKGEYSMLKHHCGMLHEQNIELEAKAAALSAILLELGSKREKAVGAWDDATVGGHIRNINKVLWLRFTGALELLEQQKGKKQ